MDINIVILNYKISDYPLNYDNLDQNAVQTLIDWLNWCDKKFHETHESKYYKRILNVQSIMRSCGVMIEQDFGNHHGWSLATREDARIQEKRLKSVIFKENVDEFCVKEP